MAKPDPKKITVKVEKLHTISSIAKDKKRCPGPGCMRNISKSLDLCPKCQIKKAQGWKSPLKGVSNDSTTPSKPKNKKSPYKAAEDTTFAIFSRCIRLRDTDENGIGKCIATGERIWYIIEHGKIKSNCDCGHFIVRSVKTLIFDPDNNSAQKIFSNRFNEGQKHLQRPNIVKRKGEKTVQRLESEEALWKSGKRGRLSIPELIALRPVFRKWEKELLATKNF